MGTIINISAVVVNSASFNFGVPGEIGQAIGTVTASGSPTSFSITAGNSSGFFAIDNSGHLTVANNGAPLSGPSTGMQVTTYNLTVQASGGAGIGTGSVAVVCTNLPWPSLTNRPSVSAGTITWTGPSAGGPSTINDTSQSHALSTNSGDFTTSSNGQLVQYLDITGNFILNHNNVTLSRCRIQGSVWPFSFTTGGNTGLVIEDCDLTTIDALATPVAAGHGVGALYQMTIRRIASHDAENNLTPYAQNVYLKDSLFYNVIGTDADQWELYTTTTAGNNGIGVTDNITCCHNTFQGPTVGGGFYNSAVNLTNGNQNGAGSPTTGTIGPHVYIDNNFFNDSANSHIINDDNAQGSGTIQWNATNNGFYRTGGQAYKIGRSTLLVNSGNYNMATAGDFTGSLANGTGAI